jgi:uncharacterized LabA/DUF88 family protein
MEVRYLFIDGGYLIRQLSEYNRKWFGEDAEINFNNIKGGFGAYKCFYYDCLDEIKGKNESEETFQKRIAKQKEFFNKIRSTHGTHVRLGHLAGEKKRQKEVDILLAVEMMEHAVRQNMNNVVLLSGDRDFKPLVESLVRMGVFVTVAGFLRHTSDELSYAADSYQELKFSDTIRWLHTTLINDFPLPTFSKGNPNLDEYTLIKTGFIFETPVELYRSKEYKEKDSFLILNKSY